MKLLDEVVNGMGRRAQQAVFPADEAQQDGQFQVAQVVDLVEQSFIRHREAQRASATGPSGRFHCWRLPVFRYDPRRRLELEPAEMTLARHWIESVTCGPGGGA